MSITKDPWFSRRRTPGDLETRVINSTGRCNYLDENGKDVRHQNPGLRWEVLREKRKATYKDYADRIQAAFDSVYEKLSKISRYNHLTLHLSVNVPYQNSRHRFNTVRVLL